METNAGIVLNQIRRERIPEGVQSRAVVIQGDPANQIVQLAEEEQVDMIVIATHGFSGWKKFMFGSVTEKVIRFAACPVLSIRAPQNEEDTKTDS